MLPISALTHIGAAAIIGVSVWFFQEARYSTQIAEIQLDWQHEREAIAQKARKEKDAIDVKYQTALNQSRDRERALRSDLDAVRNASQRLRAQTETAASRISEAPADSVAEYAIAIGAVFNECQARYGELAAETDRHVDSVRTLVEAWPVTDGPTAD